MDRLVHVSANPGVMESVEPTLRESIPVTKSGSGFLMIVGPNIRVLQLSAKWSRNYWISGALSVRSRRNFHHSKADIMATVVCVRMVPSRVISQFLREVLGEAPRVWRSRSDVSLRSAAP